MIAIYNDEGASAMCVNALLSLFELKKLKTRTLTGKDIQTGSWKNKTTTFIMPGGRSLPFYEILGALGNQQLIDFVKKGGKYVGLCAGAYYACKHTVFAKDTEKELLLPGALNFFDGSAIGPVLQANQFEYDSEAGACWVNILWKDQQRYPVYFNGGCHFVSDNHCVETLATYENNLQAMIQFNVEKGRVILSGVHPEIISHSPATQAMCLLEMILEK